MLEPCSRVTSLFTSVDDASVSCLVDMKQAREGPIKLPSYSPANKRQQAVSTQSVLMGHLVPHS